MDRIREKSDLRNSEEVAVALIRSSSEAPIHFAALFRDNMELEHSKVLACLLKECDSDEIPYLVKNLEGNPCLRNEGFVRRLIEECDSERQVFLFDALAGNEMLENPKIIQDFVENIQPSDLVRLVERLQGNPVLESKEIVQKLFAYCEEGNDKGVLHNLLKSEFFRTVHIKDQDIFTTVESTFELTNELITVEDKSYDKLSNLNKIYFQSVFHEVVEQYGEVGEKEIQAAFFLKTQRAIISSVFPKREEREDYRAFEITVLPGGGFTVIEGEKETIFDVLFNCSVKPVQAPLFEEGEKAKPPIPGEKDTDLDLQAE